MSALPRCEGHPHPGLGLRAHQGVPPYTTAPILCAPPRRKTPARVEGFSEQYLPSFGLARPPLHNRRLSKTEDKAKSLQGLLTPHAGRIKGSFGRHGSCYSTGQRHHPQGRSG